jgi:FkbM family methyltransferase
MKWLTQFFERSTSQRHACKQYFYGQEAEDAVLFALMENAADQRGFFVDVGAHHPQRFSNTYKFYQAGWRGINIDPTPGCMVEFNVLRPEDTNLEIGVSQRAGVRYLYCYNEPALNGIDNDRRDEFEHSQYRLEKIIKVKTMALGEILAAHGVELKSPNFLSIDVEGLEMEVLSSISLDQFPFDFVVIEQRIDDVNKVGLTDAWRMLTQKHYIAVAVTGRTVIYRRSKTDN